MPFTVWSFFSTQRRCYILTISSSKRQERFFEYTPNDAIALFASVNSHLQSTLWQHRVRALMCVCVCTSVSVCLVISNTALLSVGLRNLTTSEGDGKKFCDSHHKIPQMHVAMWGEVMKSFTLAVPFLRMKYFPRRMVLLFLPYFNQKKINLASPVISDGRTNWATVAPKWFDQKVLSCRQISFLIMIFLYKCNGTTILWFTANACSKLSGFLKGSIQFAVQLFP